MVSLPPGCQDKDLKMKFLRSIISVCRSARNCDLWCGLDAFCNKYELAEHIKVMGNPLVALGGVQGQAVGTGLSRALAGASSLRP